MKNLKSKIVLSVLALACVGAGALNLQTNVSANAEGEEATTEVVNKLTIDQLNSYAGAEICVSDDFSGIRWKARTPQGFPFVDADGNFMADAKAVTDTNGAVPTNGEGAVFGMLIAPAGTYGEELTMADYKEDGTGAMNLAFEAGHINTTLARVYYYAVLNYDDLGEQYQQNAYKLNLTGRAYMYFQNEYYYATIDNDANTRSAERIAANCEADGTIDEYRAEGNQAKAEKFVAYYGGTEATVLGDRTKYFVDDTVTQVVDMEAFATTPSVEVELDLGEATYRGAAIDYESVTATYDKENKKLTITDFGSVTNGEHYLIVYTSNGPVIKSLITATKVLKSIEDFEMFSYIRNNYVEGGKITTAIQAGIDEDKCQFSGYYVLASNIDATKKADGTDYTKPVIGCQGGWIGNSNWVKADYGLTGTFNGMGYAVMNYTETNANAGLFNLVKGGTIKNFALTNFKTTSGNYQVGLAYIAIDPTLKNVYIEMTGGSMYMNSGAFFYIYQTKDKAAKLQNVFLKVNLTAVSAGSKHAYTGSLCAANGNANATTYAFTNVISISNVGLTHYVNKSGVLKTYGYGDNLKTADGYTYVPVENYPEPTGAASATILYYKGAYSYADDAGFVAGKHDLSSFNSCWTVTTDAEGNATGVTWASLPVVEEPQA